MKSHTSEFKTQLTELGRELRGVIIYGETILEDEINSITPHYEADILKSVMKQLDLELTVDIPLNTVINCQIGILVGNDYEMLNYGNYVVYNSEKQEDTNTYKITCYDKLLYSMKQNEDLGVTYPITIKNYLIALGNKIGLSVASGTFYNQDLQIPSELYLGQEYTYRDILDEIAQATGSIICLNENDEILVKYPTITGDTIDEEYLKDINVDFGQKYGVINSIVLSRAGESDNVYLRDEQSVEQMNFNNRSDYLQGLLAALDGLYYYLNDFNSTGILYYEVGDLYNVQIGENTYQCLMLNDEVNITTGIEEIIHTDMPEKSETDYSKADKTDMRINKTYLIVDKQNQTIESVVNNVTSQNNKISQITQTVDELNSKIQDIADITTYGESTQEKVVLTNINESEPIMIRTSATNGTISYLYPLENLYPDDFRNLWDRIIRFTNTKVFNLTEDLYYNNYTTYYRYNSVNDEYELLIVHIDYEYGDAISSDIYVNPYIDYTLPDDLLRYSSNVYDEFYLDYDSQTCQVIKRCAYNADGSVRALGTEITTDYPYPTIFLTEGDYEITLPVHVAIYLYVRLMAKNIYTTQFYTKVETNSIIDQKADEIDLSVNQKLTNYSTTNEMNSAINIKADQITSEVSQTYATKDTTNSLSSRIKQTAKSIELTTTDNGTSAGITIRVRNEDGTQIDSDSGNITLSGKVAFTNLTDGTTTISGSNIKTGTIDASQVNVTNLNASNITSGNISGTRIKGGTIDGEDVNITNLNASNITSGTISGSKISGGTINGNNVSITNLSASNIKSGTLNGDNITVKNLSASSITTGTLNGISLKNNSISSATISGTSISGGSLSDTPYSFSGSSNDTISISSSTSGTIEGYYGSKSSANRRYSLKAFTSGGRFQSFNSSGGQASYFDHQGAHTVSDIRLKNNITNIEQEKSLNIINNLTPIEFTYKADEKEYHRGLSAQEVEQVLKNNGIEKEIYEIRENGDYSLNYSELIPDLINCIKYLTKEIEKIKGGK